MCTSCEERAASFNTRRVTRVEKYAARFEQMQEWIGCGNLNPTGHSMKRSFERVFASYQVKEALMNGFCIDAYFRYREYTFLVSYFLKVGKAMYRPIHVVVAFVPDQEVRVVTVYSPSTHSWKWDKNYEQKVCFCKDATHAHQED